MSIITVGQMNGMVMHLFVKYFDTLFEYYNVNVLTIIRGLRMDIGFYDKMKRIIMSIEDDKQFAKNFNKFAEEEDYNIDFADMIKFINYDWFTDDDNKIFLEFDENTEEDL